GVGAAGLVGGGDPEVVRLFELLREQAALEGDGGLAVAAFALAEPFRGLDLVGYLGAEDEDAADVVGGEGAAAGAEGAEACRGLGGFGGGQGGELGAEVFVVPDGR